MNHIYQSVRNDKTGTFVAVSEVSSAGRKSSSGASGRAGTVAGNTCFTLKALAISVMVAFGANAYALPVGGVVAQGGASISNGAGSTTITQSSQNVAINWQSFSIGATEAVRFVQPNSSSVALNRVLGADPSSILGSMSANGKVFLLNPNGILFGRGSQVNVGGLVASTLNMTDSDFMAGNYRFSGSSDAAVVNQGTINAPGGYVALLGANVANDGTILARLGTVALAAGNAMTLDVAGDGLLNVTVSQGAVNALVQNGGLIQADGGNVLLTAMAAGDLLQSAVNNTGVIRAQTIENHNGTIRLMGDMQIGTVNVGGTLDASAPNGGNGGFIETSAAHVQFADNFNITTAAPTGVAGTFLIDPEDFIVGAGGNIGGAGLVTLLLVNNVIISTNTAADTEATGVLSTRNANIIRGGATPLSGDIIINDVLTWTGVGGPGAATTLTLNANRDVIFNAAINNNRSNIVVCCGRNIEVNAAITTVGGSILFSAGNDILVNARITQDNGNITMCAGRNIDINARITMIHAAGVLPNESLGLPFGLVLSAGNAATGPGAAGGTVRILSAAGERIQVTGLAPVTPLPVSITYNPASYAVGAETDYSVGTFDVFTRAVLTQFMLVYPEVTTKTLPTTTAATFTGFLRGAAPGVTLPGVTLNGTGAPASFDTVAEGTNIVTFNSNNFSLTQPGVVTGGTGRNFALATPCCGMVTRTTGTILAALPIVPPIPPVPPPAPPVPPVVPLLPPVVPLLPVEAVPVEAAIFAPEEMMGPEAYMTVATILPNLMPRIELAGLPPQLLSIAPVRVPVVVPPPPPPVIEEVPIYVPPVRPLKQDRN